MRKRTESLLRRRTGRRPGKTYTREEILVTARRLFAGKGYAGVTLRDIAADAKVDVGLVSHFFRSKDELFFECIHIPTDAFKTLRAAFQGPTCGLGERVVRAYFELWENPDTAKPLLSIVRSAFSHERSATLLSEYSQTRLMRELGLQLERHSSKNSEILMETAFATLFGVAVARYVFRIGRFAELDTDKIVTLMASTVQGMLVPG